MKIKAHFSFNWILAQKISKIDSTPSSLYLLEFVVYTTKLKYKSFTCQRWVLNVDSPNFPFMRKRDNAKCESCE